MTMSLPLTISGNFGFFARNSMFGNGELQIMAETFLHEIVSQVEYNTFHSILPQILDEILC